MSHTSDYTTVSVIKELDPEPQPGGRFLHMREFLLGVALLAAVLGWAGKEWWQQDQQQSNYRAGTQAAARMHWNEAGDYFAAASGYRDATARATQAAQSVASRDLHYNAATHAISSTQWLTAFNELQAAHIIQPDYLDSPALYSLAQNHVYRDALYGAVVLNINAQPPGLYYRGDDTWVWLQGSDRWSQVRASSSVTGTVIYDVPGEGWILRPSPTAVAANHESPPGSPQLADRRLKAVSLKCGKAPLFHDLSLNPADYVYYTATVEGVVAWRFRRGTNNVDPVRASYTGREAEADYEAYTSPLTTTIVQADEDRAVLDISVERNMVLWAQWSGISLKSSNIQLYVSHLDGTSTREIYRHTGELGGGQLSPDGRYVLLTTITSNTGLPAEEQSALLLDLSNPSQSSTLANSTVEVQTIGSYFRHPLAIKGAFLSRGVFAGKALVTVQSKDGVVFTLHDVVQPEKAATLASMSGLVTVVGVQEQEDGSELIISGIKGYSEFADDRMADTHTFFMKLVPGKPAIVSEIVSKSDANSRFAYEFGMKNGYFVYADVGMGSTGVSSNLNSIPEGLLNPGKIEPKQVYTVTELNNRMFSTGQSNMVAKWYLGKRLFAFTDGGSLYARLYGGEQQAKLETGVTALFSPFVQTNMRFLR